MGFAWESANVRNFGMPEVWDYPSPSPRHRKPPRRLSETPVGRGAMVVATAAARRARAVVNAGPVLADHRRAF
jgi:hypothetical protein